MIALTRYSAIARLNKREQTAAGIAWSDVRVHRNNELMMGRLCANAIQRSVMRLKSGGGILSAKMPRAASAEKPPTFGATTRSRIWDSKFAASVESMS